MSKNEGCLITSLIDVASFAGGAYVGFCHASNYFVDPKLAKLVFIGPAAVGGLEGVIAGGIIGSLAGYVSTEKARDCLGGGCLGALGFGILGAAYKEIVMGIGYVLGYIVGKIIH